MTCADVKRLKELEDENSKLIAERYDTLRYCSHLEYWLQKTSSVFTESNPMRQEINKLLNN